MYYDLKPGDKIGLVSPSRHVAAEEIAKGVAYLKSLGFEPVFGEHVFDSFRYMGGTAENRAADIMRFYADPEIKAIFATSGGDGAQFIPPLLDWDIICRNPKPFIGFSDTTALQNAIVAQTGQIAFSGLTLNYDFRGEKLDETLDASLKNILFGEQLCYKSGETLVSGQTEGVLLGGCLSLFRNLCGTPYFPNMNGAVLLIEDVEEPTYKIDLMLQQISQNPGFRQVKGIIFGRFLDCPVRRPEDGTIDEVLGFFADGLKIPVIKNFDYGHVFKRLMMPLGAKIRLDAATSQPLVMAEG